MYCALKIGVNYLQIYDKDRIINFGITIVTMWTQPLLEWTSNPSMCTHYIGYLRHKLELAPLSKLWGYEIEMSFYTHRTQINRFLKLFSKLETVFDNGDILIREPHCLIFTDCISLHTRGQEVVCLVSIIEPFLCHDLVTDKQSLTRGIITSHQDEGCLSVHPQGRQTGDIYTSLV